MNSDWIKLKKTWLGLLIFLTLLILIGGKSRGVTGSIENARAGKGRLGDETSLIGRRPRPETTAEYMERKIAEAQKAFDEEMAKNPPPTGPPVETLNADGNLTTGIIEAAELTQQEIAVLTEKIAGVRQLALDDVVSRTRFVSRTGGLDGRVDTYYISARKDRGEEFQKMMSDAVKDVIGDRAEILKSGMRDESIYGGFGRSDIEVKFTFKDETKTANYNYMDANNGKVFLTGGRDAEEFNKMFGGIFDIQPD